MQPPGEWVRIALEVAGARSLALPAKARLLALLGVTLSDSSIPTVRTKFVHRHWRPETAILQAGTNGNPCTDQDQGYRTPRPSTRPPASRPLHKTGPTHHGQCPL